VGGILARSLEPVLAFYQHFIQINILSRKCLCRTFTIGIQEMALSLDQIFSTTVLNLLVPDASLDYMQLFSDLPNVKPPFGTKNGCLYQICNKYAPLEENFASGPAFCR